MKDESFELFYKKYIQYFISFAMEFVDKEDDAYDIVQEVFLACWMKNISFDDVNNAKAYLYRAVRNSCINHLRKFSRTKSIDDSNIDVYSEEYLEEQIIKEEIAMLVRERIVQLSPQEQKVIRLSLIGCSVKEVAEKMNISINTVKVYKKRAYSQLRDNLRALKTIISLVIV